MRIRTTNFFLKSWSWFIIIPAFIVLLSFSVSVLLRYFYLRVAAQVMSYGMELRVAELAVQRATLMTQKVFKESAKGTLSKEDKSPVTKGDFGAQALIIQAILNNFHEDEIVAEEEAGPLRENKKLRDEIWELVKDVKLSDEASDALLGGPLKDEEHMLNVIDSGKGNGGAKGRVWALDPIDGTLGFLRGGQYAVCLALIENGVVKVGVIGAPNLPISSTEPIPVDGASMKTDGEYGVLFSTVAGKGALCRPLTAGALAESHKISMRAITDISKTTFCEGVEASHSSQGDNAVVAKLLGITSPSVRLDSQAKYCSIARGAGDIYLRLPARKNYQEKIWDHAAGDLLVREAGGQVTDIYGKRLDFGQGRTLAENTGVVASPKTIHPQVIAAVKEVLKPGEKI